MPFHAPDGTELLAHLGTGGVFDVALVRDARADPSSPALPLICKRLTTRAVRERAGRAAIVREARALSLARHPSLPALVRVGTDGHGPFLLETRVEGVSLRGLVEGWRARGRRPPATLVAHVARAAVEALAELQELQREGADERGPLDLVHGDLDPDHVLLGPLGGIGLVDLGAARFRGMEPELETDDRGTLPFVAPEVARGEEPPSMRADVYSMAAALAWLATGEPLTRARDEAAVLVEIAEQGLLLAPLRAAEGLSPPERAALARALSRDPAERFPTARALLEAFDAGREVQQGGAR